MLDLSSLAAEEVKDCGWVELFPWLDDYVSERASLLERLGTDEWWLEDSPRTTAEGTSLEKLLKELSELFVAGHKSLALALAFPSLDPDLPVSALVLGARAATLVGRLTSGATVRDLLSLSVHDAFKIKGTSEGTVRELVDGLLGCAVLVEPSAGAAADVRVTTQPAVIQLVDDLAAFAYWRTVRGMSDRPLLTVSIDDEAPEQVQEVAARIAALTPLDLPAPRPNDAVDEIENLAEQLDDRESLILRERLMAAEKQTLGALAVKLNLSAGRVSQLESAVKARFNSFCGYGTAVGNLLASMRVEIQPVASLDRLLELHPTISSTVPSLGVPLWLVLDRLDDYFDVKDGWAAAPDVGAAKRRTLSLLEDLESDNGVVDLDEATVALSMDHGEFESWLQWCSVPVIGGHALLRTKRIADHAVGALEALGGPRSASELRELVDPGRTVEGVERCLSSDARARRDTDGQWHLVEWAAAVAVIEATVPEATFRKDESGAVRRRTQGRAKTPDSTRRLYRIGIGWRYRVVVTGDHLRGSGFSLPAGVATAVGCERGETVELASRLGEQAIRWTGAQPTIGSIRRFLAELPVKVGDSVYLDFAASREFDVAAAAAVPEDADPLRRALSLIGHSAPMSIAERHQIRVLADAIGMAGETRPRRLLGAYEAASEEAVVELLETAWMHASSTDEVKT
ncbi:sigma factor-like helix-turn-helix DNA-binding protein [Rhodococcus sp. 1168]|uniref:sigma factor-like helix-turn-helix DNA-binding protein n=1 Tax=Rhodococcus sp. 1168 TaxID=2018041 RepID=UPI000A0C1DAD|nr:sigma factor-like helix-turn-helix DNA-binding protein [Rhodococcus sp. 1168]ORI21122.1 hypothetical protein BJI47_16870 [Rhodococcus sp. 1168]